VLGFGSADAHDFYSTFYGYQPFILNSRGKWNVLRGVI
jgi:hypothetical protein